MFTLHSDTNLYLIISLAILFVTGATQTAIAEGGWINEGTNLKMEIPNLNVGIGTSNPIRKLDVAGGIKAAGSLWLDTSGPSILFNENGYNAARIHHGGNYSGGILEIETYSSGWRRTDLVLSEGNMGLGTTCPRGRFDIRTGRYIDLYFSGSSSADIYSGTGHEMIIGTLDYGDLSLVTGGRDLRRLTILDDGRVGIGTASPNSMLHLKGDDDTVLVIDSGCDEQSSSIQFRADGQKRWQIGQGIGRDSTSFYIHDMVNNYIRMAISPDGNVGIGTSIDKKYMLNVGGGINSSEGYYLEGQSLDTRYLLSGTDHWIDSTGDTITGNLVFDTPGGQTLTFRSHSYGIGVQNKTEYFRTGGDFAWYKGGAHTSERGDSGGGNTLMVLKSDGNLGLGATDPGSSRLYVQGGNITVNRPQTGAGEITIGSINGAPGIIGKNPDQPLIVESVSGTVCIPDARVGIGTGNPTEKLEVNGRIKDKTGYVMPVGAVMPFAGLAAPAGWMLCNGDAVSRMTYAELFAVVKTLYGIGDGVTTFHLPNLAGRIPAGRDPEQPEFESTGKTGGEKTHVLTEDELPAHDHSNTDQFPADGNYGDWEKLSTLKYGVGNGDSTSQYLASKETTPAGGGTPHNNLQPYLVLTYIIKY